MTIRNEINTIGIVWGLERLEKECVCVCLYFSVIHRYKLCLLHCLKTGWLLALMPCHRLKKTRVFLPFAGGCVEAGGVSELGSPVVGAHVCREKGPVKRKGSASL